MNKNSKSLADQLRALKERGQTNIGPASNRLTDSGSSRCSICVSSNREPKAIFADLIDAQNYQDSLSINVSYPMYAYHCPHGQGLHLTKQSPARYNQYIGTVIQSRYATSNRNKNNKHRPPCTELTSDNLLLAYDSIAAAIAAREVIWNIELNSSGERLCEKCGKYHLFDLNGLPLVVKLKTNRQFKPSESRTLPFTMSGSRCSICVSSNREPKAIFADLIDAQNYHDSLPTDVPYSMYAYPCPHGQGLHLTKQPPTEDKQYIGTVIQSRYATSNISEPLSDIRQSLPTGRLTVALAKNIELVAIAADTNKEPHPKGRGIGIPKTMAKGAPQAVGNLPAMIKFKNYTPSNTNSEHYKNNNSATGVTTPTYTAEKIKAPIGISTCPACKLSFTPEEVTENHPIGIRCPHCRQLMIYK